MDSERLQDLRVSWDFTAPRKSYKDDSNRRNPLTGCLQRVKEKITVGGASYFGKRRFNAKGGGDNPNEQKGRESKGES